MKAGTSTIATKYLRFGHLDVCVMDEKRRASIDREIQALKQGLELKRKRTLKMNLLGNDCFDLHRLVVARRIPSSTI